MRSVRFLFIAAPMGNEFMVKGYTPIIETVPALATDSISHCRACDGASPGTQFPCSGL